MPNEVAVDLADERAASGHDFGVDIGLAQRPTEIEQASTKAVIKKGDPADVRAPDWEEFLLGRVALGRHTA